MQSAPPRGTRDFFPDDMRIRDRIFSVWRETALNCGFEPYDSSVLEHEELYVLKSGGEILGQLFNFVDKGGRRVCLRPEMTPTLARMIASKGSALPKPIKWFSIAQCFRYERMSRGRKREHFQWNLDIVGVSEVTAEAELVFVALAALEQLGLTERDIVVRISHRGLLSGLLQGLGVRAEAWGEVFRIIDKLGKETDEAVREQIEGLGVPEGLTDKLFSMLNDKRLDAFSEFLEERNLDRRPLEDLASFFFFAERYGIREYCEFAPTIVRGLPYYTGIVFECFDREGRFRAVFGGGRYDNLMEMFSADQQPAVGLGFGDVVVQEILQHEGKVPPLNPGVDFFLIPYSENERGQAIEILQRIRRRGISSDILLSVKKLKLALREADRLNVRWAILLLPDEMREGILVLKHLSTGTEKRVEKTKFMEEIMEYAGR